MLEAYKRSHKVKSWGYKVTKSLNIPLPFTTGTCINFSTQEMFLQGLLRVQ